MSTIYCAKDVDSVCRALVQQYNVLHQATIATTTGGYHRDISGVPGGEWSHPSSTVLTVSAASATTLGTSLAMTLNLQGVLYVHSQDISAHFYADGYADGSHSMLIDMTSPTTELATLILMANQIKKDFNAHLTWGGLHLNNDNNNSVSTADATDQTSLNTLVNQLKSSLNSHMSSGPLCGRIKLLGDSP